MPLDPSIILGATSAGEAMQKQQATLAQQQAAQQQAQLQGLQVQQAKQDWQDQQNLRSAWQQAKGDPTQTLAIFGKMGGSAKAALAFQMQQLELQTKMATLDKTKAETGKSLLDQQVEHNTMLGDLLAPVANAKDVPTFSRELQSAVAKAKSQGLIDDKGVDQYLRMSPDEAKTAYSQLIGWQANAKAAKDLADANKANVTADTTKQKQDNESAGQIADTLMKSRQAALPNLEQALKIGPDAYAQELAKQDPHGKLGFPTVDQVKQMKPQDALQTISDLGTSEEQKIQNKQAQVNSARESQALAEKTRHDQVVEGIAQATNKREAQKFSMEFGGDAVKGWTEQLKQNPSAIEEVPANLRTAVSQQFMKDTGAPLPTKLTGADKTTFNNAGFARGVVADVRNMAQTHEIQSIIGTVSGRIANGESTAGMGLTSAQQEFVTKLEYLFAGEGKTIFGGRAPEKLMAGLKAVSASPSKGLPQLLGALDATDQVAQQRQEAIVAGQFGGKLPDFYKKSAHGQSASPAASGNTINLADIQKQAKQFGASVDEVAAEYRKKGWQVK